MIKKVLLLTSILIVSLMAFSLQVLAVPAMSSTIELSQPSGEKFKAFIQGDEFLNWVTTETGDIIVQDSDKYWKYATTSSGKIKPSKVRFKIDKPKERVTKKEFLEELRKNKILKTNNLDIPKDLKEKLFSSKQSSTANLSSSSNIQVISQSVNASDLEQSIQTEKILVLLVEFTDAKIKYSDDAWSNRFFGTTGSTVNNYYMEVSNNKFKFVPASESSGKINDGVIKITLNYAHPNTGSNTDSRNQKIVYDALTAANPYIDYSSFDTDHNGYITPKELHLLTVVAGYDRSASSTSPSVWGHSWALFGSYYATLDGVGLSKYTQIGENIWTGMSTIGLPCHELGHDLGLPDLYDYTYNSDGLGKHSLMAGGSWNANGDSPAHMDAFCKIKLGYVDPIVTTSGLYTVNNFITGQYNVIKVTTSDPKQYFLLENREFNGFDAPLKNYLKSGGIAIYHVDESIGNNNNVSRKLVDLEEANEGILGYSQLDTRRSYPYDHYFYSGGVYQITPSSIPNTNLYNSISTNHKFKVLSISSNSMSVEINNSGPVARSQLEYPTSNSTISNSIIVKGWLLEPDGIQDINVYLDGVLQGKAVYGDSRPDILSQYPTYNNANAGFHYSLDTKNFINGSHVLKITEVSGKAETKEIANIAIKVLNGVTVSYKLSTDSNTAVIIKDSQGNLVRTVETNIPRKAGYNSIVWDGNNNSGSIIDNGTYTYNITARTNIGAVSEPANGNIIVGDGPEIISVSDSPDPFEPDENAVCNISFKLTQRAKTTLQLFAAGGNPIKTLIDEDLEAGTHSLIWKGDDATGKTLSNGVYYYTIDAVTASGKTAPQASGTITINTVPPAITTLGYSPSVFNPYASKMQIGFTLSKNCKTTIDIFDSSNNLVNRIENNLTRLAGLNQAVWDGRNSSGIIVQSGTYKFAISLVDTAGLVGQSKSFNFTVKSEVVVLPVINAASFSPNPFNPAVNGSGSFTFNYSKAGYITLQVFNSSNTLVKTIANNTLCSQGINTFTWNGKDNSGAAIPAGTYTFTISGSDQSGLSAAPVSGTITVIVNTTVNKPVVSNFSASPNPINPDTNQQSKIQYSLSISAPVKIIILNASGSVIKTLFDGSANVGTNSVVWDGKNTAGTISSSGLYTCKVQAFSSGQIVSEVSGTILVDKDPPSISVDDVEPNPFTPIE